MSDSVTDTTQVSRYADAIGKLRSISSGPASAHGDAGSTNDSSEMLGDAFAQVFAAMAASSVKPPSGGTEFEEADSTSGAEEVSGEQNDSDSEDADQTTSLSTDDSSESSEPVIIAADTASVEPEQAIESEVDFEPVSQEIDDEVIEQNTEAIAEVEVAEAVAVVPDQRSTAPVEKVATATEEQAKPEAASADTDSGELPTPDDFVQQTKTSQDGPARQPTESTEVAATSNSDSPSNQGGQQDESQNRRRYSQDETKGLAEANAARPNASPQGTATGNEAASPAASTAAAETLSALEGGSAAGSTNPNVNPVAAAARAAANTSSSAALAAQAASNRVGGAGQASPLTTNQTTGLERASALTSTTPAATAGADKAAKSTATDASKADMMNRIKLIQRVSKAFQHLGPEGGVVRLRLAPVELGTVRVEMRIDQKRVNARVVAETEAAAAALQEHLPDLRARLEGYGMQVEKLDIETESFADQSSRFDEQAKNDQSERRSFQRDPSDSGFEQRRHSDRVRSEAAAPVSRVPIAATASGGVDIHF